VFVTWSGLCSASGVHYGAGACWCCAEPVLPAVAYCVCACTCMCYQNIFLAVTNSRSPQSPFVLEKLLGWSNSAHFVDPEGLLLFPLVPTLIQKNPFYTTPFFLSDLFQYCIYSYAFKVASVLHVFPPQPCLHSPYMSHAGFMLCLFSRHFSI